jgi:hypothetical protein
LDEAIRKELLAVRDSSATVKVVVLGGGFDTRALRFGRDALVASLRRAGKAKVAANLTSDAGSVDWYELDLPAVAEQKRVILERYLLRRGEGFRQTLPGLCGVDLNDIAAVKMHLADIFEGEYNPHESKPATSSSSSSPPVKGSTSKVIFVIEAVLLYLREENVEPLLSACVSAAARHTDKISVCFADRLPGLPVPAGAAAGDGGERDAAAALFQHVKLSLTQWRPRPGRARHMGVATYTL